MIVEEEILQKEIDKKSGRIYSPFLFGGRNEKY
jgi:hypothetical protein